jgi:(2Fe-2S) ferredoxin
VKKKEKIKRIVKKKEKIKRIVKKKEKIKRIVNAHQQRGGNVKKKCVIKKLKDKSVKWF